MEFMEFKVITLNSQDWLFINFTDYVATEYMTHFKEALAESGLKNVIVTSFT